MTANRNQHSSDDRNEMLLSSPAPSAAEKYLQMAVDLYHEDLSQATVVLWRDYLSSLSPQEIEYAFTSWTRNSKYFPKPAEIQELVGAYRDIHRPQEPFKYKPTGWGEPQVIALWNLRLKRYPNTKPGEYLTVEQWEEMMAEVQNRYQGVA